jgi:hypothetical protein
VIHRRDRRQRHARRQRDAGQGVAALHHVAVGDGGPRRGRLPWPDAGQHQLLPRQDDRGLAELVGLEDRRDADVVPRGDPADRLAGLDHVDHVRCSGLRLRRRRDARQVCVRRQREHLAGADPGVRVEMVRREQGAGRRPGADGDVPDRVAGLHGVEHGPRSRRRGPHDRGREHERGACEHDVGVRQPVEPDEGGDVRAEPQRDTAQGVTGLDDVGRRAGRGLGDGGDDDRGHEGERGDGDEPKGPAPTVAGPASRQQRHDVSSVTHGVCVTTEEKVN